MSDDTGAPVTTEAGDLLYRLDCQWQEAKAWWAPVREKAQKARDYYHMLQWTAQQEAALKRQGRAATVINLIGKAVDNICGRERSARYDWKASPVGQDDLLSAAAMTHGLKSIARQTDAKFAFSEAFEDAILGPMGWVEVSWDNSDPEATPYICERVEPFEMYFDPHGRRADFRDAKYLIRRRVVDVEDAIQLDPARADEIRAAAFDSKRDDDETVIAGDYDNRADANQHYGSIAPGQAGQRGRRRVALREHHWWEREHTAYIQMPDGKRYYQEHLDEATAYQLMAGGGEIAEGHRRVYYRAIVGAGLVLHHGPSELPFGRFPYVAVWAKRDGEGRPYGLVELAIPPQEEVNTARSRLNEALRSRWLIYRTGSLGPTTAAEVGEQLARANFVLEVEEPGAVQIGSDRADVMAWLRLMEEAKKEIDDVFGNNETAYGDKDNTAQSGKAKALQVQQQALNLGKLFDNLRWSRKQAGQMFLSLLQAFTTPEEMARIIGASVLGGVAQQRIGPDGRPVQLGTPDLSWLQPLVAGPLYQARYDAEIEDQAETGTQRQAEMQARVEMLGMVPDDLKATMIPDTLRASDWGGAEELAAKVEQRMAPPQMGAPPGPPGLPQPQPTQQPPAPMPGGFS